MRPGFGLAAAIVAMCMTPASAEELTRPQEFVATFETWCLGYLDKQNKLPRVLKKAKVQAFTKAQVKAAFGDGAAQAWIVMSQVSGGQPMVLSLSDNDTCSLASLDGKGADIVPVFENELEATLKSSKSLENNGREARYTVVAIGTASKLPFTATVDMIYPTQGTGGVMLSAVP